MTRAARTIEGHDGGLRNGDARGALSSPSELLGEIAQLEVELAEGPP
jgi:hypothetical protein